MFLNSKKYGLKLLLLGFSLFIFTASFAEDYAAYAAEQRAKKNAIIAPYLAEFMPQSNIQKYQGNILIFVSFSMPKQSLRDWLLEADKVGASVIIRGLVNNSFKDTTKTLYEVIKDTGVGGISIDPTMFQKFHITRVPAVVVFDRLTNNYDVVYGDVALDYALKTIAVNGEPHNAKVAQQTLIQLRGNTNAY